jgi:nucleoside-diphosphate-sugar epimerase
MTLESPRPSLDTPLKVFITGANGFIGRALASRLREVGCQVGGVDLEADPDNGVVAGSTGNPAGWSNWLAGVDVVIHTAAIVSNAAPLDRAWEVNVLGTRRVLDAAAANSVQRFIHLSSVAAYGFEFPDGVDETYPVRVNGFSYTDTKVNSEAVVLAAHAAGEIECTIIRPVDVYGPGSHPWVVLPLQAIKKGQMLLPDGGNGIFSPVYIDNFVDGTVLAMSSHMAAGQIFILGDGYGVTCADYFGRLAGMAGGKVRTLPARAAIALANVMGFAQRRLGQASELNAATMLMLNRPGTYSIDKARHVLGFDPLVTYDDGMNRVEAWARSEGLI